MLLKGQLEEAQLENKSADPTNLPDGLVWLNTTTKLLMAVIAGSKVSFAINAVPETSVAIANNNGVAADVTGLLLSSSTARSAQIDYHIRRVTTGGGATERVERGQLLATYNTLATSWRINPMAYGGDDSGVTLTITAGGQVQYVSDNMSAGSYDATNSIIKFSVRILS